METKDGVLVYATDNEPGDENFDKAVRKLAEGADILIYDAQYLPEEYAARRRGWGHSHWREAVNIVMESGAKELILYHHDPDHTDAIVDRIITAKCAPPRKVCRSAFNHVGTDPWAVPRSEASASPAHSTLALMLARPFC
jgi:ribonuclease BN (tRNA processing enzyme)